MESRLLLSVSDLTIKVGTSTIQNDFTATAAPVQIGVISKSAADPVVTFNITNAGPSLQLNLLDQLNHFVVSTENNPTIPTNPLNLTVEATAKFTIALKTDTVGRFVELVKLADFANVGFFFFTVEGTVVAPNLGLINGTAPKQTGTVTVLDNSDTSGQARVNENDQFYQFSLGGVTDLLTVTVNAIRDQDAPLPSDLLVTVGEGTDPDHVTKQLLSKSFTTSAAASNGFTVSIPADPGPAFVLLSLANAASTSTNAATENINFDLTLAAQQLNPVVSLSGNGQPIANSGSASSANGTNFGTTGRGTNVVEQYTVKNTGTGNLTLSLKQPQSGAFDIKSAPSATIAPNGTTTFQIELLADSAGAKADTIELDTNDPNNKTFNFAIAGIVNAPAGIQVSGSSGAVLSNGDTTPSLSDGTDFGTVTVGGTPPTRAFTIHNTGDSELDLTNVAVGAGFAFVGTPPAKVSGHGTADLTLQMATDTLGSPHATVSFNTNDPSTAKFSFDVGGVVQSAPVTTPAIQVTGGGSAIVSGDSTPLTTDGTDFGAVPPGVAQSHTFVITNTGTGDDLVLGAGTFSGAGFTVGGLPATVAAGATANVTVQYLANTSGDSNATLSFATNVPGLSNFTFALHGNVPAAQAIPATLSGTVIGITGAGLAGQAVFLDTNQNGIADSGETTTTTDASGNYTFSGLLPGAYRVAQTPGTGLSVSEPSSAFHDVTLADGQILSGQNFADVLASIPTGPDLTASFAGTLPGSVIGGSKGQIKLKVTNAGTLPATGLAKVSLLISTDGTLSGSVLALPAVSLGKLSLKAKASKVVTLKFNFPSSLADGSYKVIASVDSGNVIAETSEANNLAASNAVTIARPFVDFGGTLGKITPITAGKKASVTLLLSNGGNMPAKGNLTYSFYESTDTTFDAGDILVGSAKKAASLKAGGKGSVALTFKPSGTTQGSAFLIAVIDSANVVSEKNETNNNAASAAQVAFA